MDNINTKEFLKLFCYSMLNRNITSFSRDKLSDTIFEYKNNKEFECILKNIKYTNYGDNTHYSRNLENSIAIFRIYGYLYTKGLNNYNKLEISNNIDFKNIQDNYNEYNRLINKIIDSYLEENKVLKKTSNI